MRGKELKWCLRQALKDLLPLDVVNRPKHGFNVPIDHWLKNEWSDMIEEAFCEGSCLQKKGIISENALTVARDLPNDSERKKYNIWDR